MAPYDRRRTRWFVYVCTNTRAQHRSQLANGHVVGGSGEEAPVPSCRQGPIAQEALAPIDQSQKERASEGGGGGGGEE